MSIKILGGLVKGQSLLVPKGQLIRPTSVMLRRKIFDANQNLEGYCFYDFCAGSGAMGIEAVSRGADEAIFIEKHEKVYSLLEKNTSLASTRLNTNEICVQIKIVKYDCIGYLLKFKEIYKSFSQKKQSEVLIFLDPPYEDNKIYRRFIDILFSEELWFRGKFWLESDNQKGFKEQLTRELLDEYGDIRIYKHSQSYILCLDTHL